MTVKNRLRNNLVRKIQHLSTDKLSEINDLLNKIDNQFNSKEKTLKLAGSWGNLSEETFTSLTENLHTQRAQDRTIL